MPSPYGQPVYRMPPPELQLPSPFVAQRATPLRSIRERRNCAGRQRGALGESISLPLLAQTEAVELHSVNSSKRDGRRMAVLLPAVQLPSRPEVIVEE